MKTPQYFLLQLAKWRNSPVKWRNKTLKQWTLWEHDFNHSSSGTNMTTIFKPLSLNTLNLKTPQYFPLQCVTSQNKTLKHWPTLWEHVFNHPRQVLPARPCFRRPHVMHWQREGRMDNEGGAFPLSASTSLVMLEENCALIVIATLCREMLLPRPRLAAGGAISVPLWQQRKYPHCKRLEICFVCPSYGKCHCSFVEVVPLGWCYICWGNFFVFSRLSLLGVATVRCVYTMLCDW